MELTPQNPCEILHKIDGLWGSRFQVVAELCLVASGLGGVPQGQAANPEPTT